MSNKDAQPKKIFDLSQRTLDFSRNVIELCKKIPQDIITRPIIHQLIKSATSIGANYCEADCAESKKDFEHKLSIAAKESKESSYWLTVMKTAISQNNTELNTLQQEAHELNLIFISIIRKSKAKK